MKESGTLPRMMLTGNAAKACSIDGCPGYHVARGYCMRHYTRIVRRGSSEIDAPGDLNPDKDQILTEDEFCKLKDFRSQGFKPIDVAYELQKNVTRVTEAWDCETYYEYKKAPETAWPLPETYD